MMSEPGSDWIKGLLRPLAYPHPVASVQILETHASWVILTGDFAYKIKKPVDFGFLDYSTLERRLVCCREELRLNARYAPELYLAVLPIAGPPTDPRIGGNGEPMEYAVQMRQFPESSLFDRMAREGRLLPGHMDSLAARLADFHAHAGHAGMEDGYGLPESVQGHALDNFATIRNVMRDNEALQVLSGLESWTLRKFGAQRILMFRRKAEGFVRECHGDLHLANLVLWNGQPTPFDGIEFNPDLRWIDVMSELAFLVMDLEVAGSGRLALRLLNRYLEITGDYTGLALFDYYRVYRALVRAKVVSLTAMPGGDGFDARVCRERFRGYLHHAARVIQPREPALLICHGVSGSGKSHLALRLAEELSALRIRADVERKRLSASGGLDTEGLYSQTMNLRTYRNLLETAHAVLESGFTVILDATFLNRERRLEARNLAREHGAKFLILDCRAPEEISRQRLRLRVQDGTDPSDADEAVLNRQLDSCLPLERDEAACAIRVDTGSQDYWSVLLEAVMASLDG